MKKLRAFSLIELSIVILIIGILVAGVTQGSRLVYRMKMTSAQAITQSSPVHSLRNLVVWWETTSPNSFGGTEPDDGATITNWYDINPFATSAKVQTTSASGPTYKASCLNGLPCLSFNGTSNILTTTIASSSIINSTQSSIFAVVRPQSLSAGSNRFFILINGGWTTGSFDLYIGAPAGGNRPTYEISGSSSNVVGGTALINSTAYIISATDNGTTANIFVNGGSSAGSGSPSNAIKGSGNALSIGSYVSAEFFNGYISEILIFDRALKTEEQKAVEAYLGKKWGIKVS